MELQVFAETVLRIDPVMILYYLTVQIVAVLCPWFLKIADSKGTKFACYLPDWIQLCSDYSSRFHYS